MKYRICDGKTFAVEFIAENERQFIIRYKEAALSCRKIAAHERIEVHFLDADGHWALCFRRGMPMRMRGYHQYQPCEIYQSLLATKKHADAAEHFCSTGIRKILYGGPTHAISGGNQP